MSYTLDKVVVGFLQTNCYLLADAKTKNCAIIDPGADYELIKARLDRKNLKPLFIINTHGHPDHTGANKQFNLPLYMHKDDAIYLSQKPDKLLKDAQEIQLDSLLLKVIHTPGHTPGGICILCEDILLSGDTLFESGIGRTDLPYGDEAQILNSIKRKLFTLDGNIKVYPGHGPETTIKRERS
ncbi:MAG: MBL fold metallo-hydrolase [Candidatus Omnitrophota bacterium]